MNAPNWIGTPTSWKSCILRSIILRNTGDTAKNVPISLPNIATPWAIALGDCPTIGTPSTNILNCKEVLFGIGWTKALLLAILWEEPIMPWGETSANCRVLAMMTLFAPMVWLPPTGILMPIMLKWGLFMAAICCHRLPLIRSGCLHYNSLKKLLL